MDEDLYWVEGLKKIRVRYSKKRKAWKVRKVWQPIYGPFPHRIAVAHLKLILMTEASEVKDPKRRIEFDALEREYEDFRISAPQPVDDRVDRHSKRRSPERGASNRTTSNTPQCPKCGAEATKHRDPAFLRCRACKIKWRKKAADAPARRSQPLQPATRVKGARKRSKAS